MTGTCLIEIILCIRELGREIDQHRLYRAKKYICITESSLGIGCFFFLGMQKLKEDLDSDVMKSENE